MRAVVVYDDLGRVKEVIEAFARPSRSLGMIPSSLQNSESNEKEIEKGMREHIRCHEHDRALRARER